MSEDMIECVAAAIAMKSEGWTKNAKDYIPHARAAIEAMRNGSIDVSELVERLNMPWPEHEVDEVTLPAWILELCAEAATSLTSLAAKVSETEAENAWLWGRVDELEKERDVATRNRDAARQNFLTMQNSAAAIVKKLEAAQARLAEALEALELFEQYGCPVCHGDCASANPPVYCCPMGIARRVREGG